MTEAQRYAATGTVFKPAKGKNKQQMYMKMIQEVLNTDKTLTVSQRRMLEICSKQDNVPRKIAKFKNFITNVVKNGTQHDVNHVFEVIENAWKSMSLESNMSENKEIRDNKKEFSLDSKKSKSDITDFKETSNVLTELKDHGNDIHESKKSRKKKHHLLAENEEDTIGDGVNTATINTEAIESKKERINRDNNINTEEEQLNEGLTASQNKEENIKQMTKKELKKQIKYQKYLAELENVVKTDIKDEQAEESDSKKRKKKLKKIKAENLKHLNDNGENADYDVSQIKVEESTQKKSKKRKMESTVNGIEEKKKKIDSQQEEDVVNGGSTVFNWSEVIMRVLESKSDKELSLKRLSKKVINEYQTVRADHRTYEELLARFNKKVNKTPGVRVLKDKAKLIE